MLAILIFELIDLYCFLVGAHSLSSNTILNTESTVDAVLCNNTKCSPFYVFELIDLLFFILPCRSPRPDLSTIASIGSQCPCGIVKEHKMLTILLFDPIDLYFCMFSCRSPQPELKYDFEYRVHCRCSIVQ